MSDAGGLWLADFDSAGSIGSTRLSHSPGRGAGSVLTVPDDVRALAATAIECTIGHPVDRSMVWSALELTDLGCPADLAAELAVVLRRPTSALVLAEVLAADDATLPRPSAPYQADCTPTIEFNLLDWI